MIGACEEKRDDFSIERLELVNSLSTRHPVRASCFQRKSNGCFRNFILSVRRFDGDDFDGIGTNGRRRIVMRRWMMMAVIRREGAVSGHPWLLARCGIIIPVIPLGG